MFKTLANLLLRRGDSDFKPNLDGILEQADSHLENFNQLILPAPESKPRTPFNSEVAAEQMTMLNFTVGQRLKVATKALPLFAHMQLGARMYDGDFEPSRSEVTSDFLTNFEAMAAKMGATAVGYVKVPPNAIFQGKGLPCDYAIVFTVEMDKEPIDTAPSFECQLEVMDGYKRMANISRRLANHLRRHGYEAYPGTALGGITDYPHLAELAGLGAIGYHGLLIAPGEGARLRINTIYTNISNLPTPATTGSANPHLWVREFCAMCKKCIRQCPPGAIFEEPVARGDGGMQTIDHDSCRDYFSKNYGCGVCLAVCPFSQVGYVKVKARFKGNAAAPQFRIPVQAVTVNE